MRIVTALLLAGGMVTLGAFAPAQQPPPGGGGKGDKKDPPKGGFPGKGGFGPGGPGGRMMMPQPGQLLPSFVQDTLKLSDEQKKQVDELQKEVDAKLAKILTADQLKQFKELKDRGPGGPGGRGPGGPGGPGGPPRKDGNPPPPDKGSN